MSAATPASSIPNGSPSRRLAVLALVVGGLAVAIAVVGLAVVMTRSTGAGDGLPSAVNTSDYQAVFLSNGEIYFGKLAAGSAHFYYLRNVYVLQAAPAATRSRPLRQILVKLTGEIHEPQDFMAINRGHILFIENLNPRGKAAQLLARGSGT